MPRSRAFARVSPHEAIASFAVCVLLVSTGCKTRGFNAQEASGVRALDARGISDCVRTEDDPVAVLGHSGALPDATFGDTMAAQADPLRFVAQACPPRVPGLLDTPLMAMNVSVVPGDRDLVAVAYRAYQPKGTPPTSPGHFKGAVALYEFSRERVGSGTTEKERVRVSDEALLAIPDVALFDIDLRGETLFLAGTRLVQGKREGVVGWTRLKRTEGKLTFSHAPVWRVVPEATAVLSIVAKRKRLFLGLAGAREGLVAYHRPRIERTLAVGESEILSPDFVAWQPEKPFPFDTHAIDGARVGRFVVAAHRDKATKKSGLTVVTNRGEVNGRESTLATDTTISRMSLQFGRRVTTVAAGEAGVRFLCTSTGQEAGEITPDPARWRAATSVATRRGLVFVATGSTGLEIYAARHDGRAEGCARRRVVHVHSFRFSDAAARKDPSAFVVRDVMVRGRYLFVTMGYGGLRLFRFDELGSLARRAVRDAGNATHQDTSGAVAQSVSPQGTVSDADAPELDFDPDDADAFDVEENDDAPF